MSQTIRAVYESGQLRLLDEVELSEGEEVHLMLLTPRERFRAALGDLLVQAPTSSDDELDEFDEEALMREIEGAFRGQPPLSETIIQERREGP